MLKSRKVLYAAVAALFLAPATASADTFVSPFVGVVFGGETDDTRPNFGAQVTLMGRGLGLELEAAHTPDFFEGLSITTYSANYVAGGDATAGGWKPFGSVGVTLMRASGDGESQNKFAVNLGGGIVALFTDAIGIRGEIRYFRRLQDDEEGLFPRPDVFDYWRAAGGLVFRF
ncbi:MAG: outer membrane beta-barrel protein [Vicinamibacterales bacterium]